MPGVQVNWAHLEETIQDVWKYGKPAPNMRAFFSWPLSAAAIARCERVNKAHKENDLRAREGEQGTLRALGSSTSGGYAASGRVPTEDPASPREAPASP